MVSELRAAVHAELGYTCSAGIAHTKLLAKLASGLHKPAQQTVVPAAAVPGGRWGTGHVGPFQVREELAQRSGPRARGPAEPYKGRCLPACVHACHKGEGVVLVLLKPLSLSFPPPLTAAGLLAPLPISKLRALGGKFGEQASPGGPPGVPSQFLCPLRCTARGWASASQKGAGLCLLRCLLSLRLPERLAL